MLSYHIGVQVAKNKYVQNVLDPKFNLKHKNQPLRYLTQFDGKCALDIPVTSRNGFSVGDSLAGVHVHDYLVMSKFKVLNYCRK